ncbi:MAG: Segregation and condensation protein B [Parcubacteria group bacterium GW2011_GWA2_47_16]|nr:MAG: Segregation and condensation protein B [Parcubacteria group bacterium GW2011_GWA2_47_16]
MTLDAKIEAVLFWKAEPMAVSRLAKIFTVTADEIKKTLPVLETKLHGRGVTLVIKDDEVALRTSSDVSDLIDSLAKEELTRDLGKAGLETLSIVLYQGPISRREIDYIRGVNSNFILRNLLVRGLVEKIDNPKDQRSFLYRPTFDLLSLLGISKTEDLPEYPSVRKEIEAFTVAPPETESNAVLSEIAEEVHES